MKVILIFFILFLLPLTAEAVAIFPAQQQVAYSPEEPVSFSVSVRNTAESDMIISLNLEGDLVQYLQPSNAQSALLTPGGFQTFSFDLIIPLQYSLAGQQTIRFIATEGSSQDPLSSGGISAFGSISGLVGVFIPFPKKYLSVGMTTENVNQGEDIVAHITYESQGEDDIGSIRSVVELSDLKGKHITSQSVNLLNLKSGSSQKEDVFFSGDDLIPDFYNISIETTYSSIRAPPLSTVVRVGQFLIQPVSLTEEFLENTINMVSLNLENNWNGEVGGVYADFIVYDKNEIISEVTSGTITVQPMSQQGLSFYWDTSGINLGKYRAKVIVYFGDKTSEEEFEVKIVRAQEKSNNFGVLMILGIVLLVLILEYAVLKKKYRGSTYRL